MPYRLLNIGQLLFILPNPELKQKVRILEKLNKRFINAKIGTIFNITCLIKGLFPAYTNIYIYIYVYVYFNFSHPSPEALSIISSKVIFRKKNIYRQALKCINRLFNAMHPGF